MTKQDFITSINEKLSKYENAYTVISSEEIERIVKDKLTWIARMGNDPFSTDEEFLDNSNIRELIYAECEKVVIERLLDKIIK